MPKFIGHREHTLNKHVSEAPAASKLVKISYSQKVRLPQDQVYYCLDTSDRGGPRSFAKRWNRWYATQETILACEKATPKTKARAMA